MKASNWRPVERGALRGFFDLLLPSGMKLMGCALYQKEERIWVGLPSKVEIDRDGKCKTDINGKRVYTDTVIIVAKDARERFQRDALAAVEEIRPG